MENVKNPNSQINLIREFFGATLQELKALTMADRHQLASAIARSNGLTAKDCGWELCDY
jgi:hypothetical protein